MTTTTIIINEQHSLLASQRTLLEENFGSWNTILVPAEGWNREEQENVYKNLTGIIIFISPIPYLIKLSAISMATNGTITNCFVMANDRREKKELPNGKVIFTVAKEGWYLA